MRQMNARAIVVKLMDGSTLTGKTNLGDNKRLSDRLNRGDDPFLTVFDVSFQGQSGRVLFINKAQIMWAMPLE